MICFNHNEVQACGVCKSCSKGICMECATDLGDGIACTTSCVEDVRKLNSLVRRNVKVNHATSRTFIMPIFYIVIGAVLLAVNLYLKKTDSFALFFGVVLVLFGAYSLYSGIKLNKEDSV